MSRPTTAPRPGARALRRPPAWLAAVLDVALILVFAAVGRVSHAESSPLAGVLGTAWPFLAGAAVGWVVVRWSTAAWPQTMPSGIPVVLATVLLGMLLRVATGAGIAFSFVVVATVVLGTFLLGWRALAARFP